MAFAFLWLVAGITAGALTALYHLCFGTNAAHAYCATLRTGVMVGLALLLAWAGFRWKRIELSWLVYPAMLVGAYRLVAEDLHQHRTVALFLSLLMYGAALTVLPRMRASRTSSTAK